MTKYEELQAEHQKLLDQKEASSDAKAMLAAVQAHIERVKTEAAHVNDPRDRSQLRANLRFWASYVFDRTGAYPDTSLRPALEAAPPPPSTSAPEPWVAMLRKPVFWVVALSVLVVGVFATPAGRALVWESIHRGYRRSIWT
jgi:hypothetical protein